MLYFKVMGLAQRSVRSVTWNTVSSLVSLPVSFVQSILLARLLPVEYFGVFAAVSSVISLSGTVFEFGFTNALIHRSPETEDEDRATSTFFTLRLLFDVVWAALLILFGWISLSDQRRYVLIVLVISTFFFRLTLTPKVLLVRRVDHRRLAVIELATGVTSAVLSVSIAFFYRSIWALLISSVVSMAYGFIGMYLWRPFWKPRLLWDRSIIRYFFSFGVRNLVNNLLDSALDNVDNLWTSFFLGDFLLGFYSRAFKFAIYPRTILAAPVNSVAIGTYAELKYDRPRLSRAFYQTNAFLVRTGFLLAGWLGVIAPYFIRLLIGERWLPMLSAFRLMMVFAMLDPIKVTISSVLVAVGIPERVTVVRVVQFMVMAAGLFTLGFRYQIAGVALSVDLMVITGTALLLAFARKYVDVSFRRLFLAPAIALGAALLLNWVVGQQISSISSDWLLAGIKTSLFVFVYLAVLFAIEGKDLIQDIKEMTRVFSFEERVRAFFALKSGEG